MDPKHIFLINDPRSLAAGFQQGSTPICSTPLIWILAHIQCSVCQSLGRLNVVIARDRQEGDI